MHFDLKKPCSNCPFRNDIPAYLTQGRVAEIDSVMDRGWFACHKTTVDSDDDDSGDRVTTDESQHCAGALILMEKSGRKSQVMQIAERLDVYSPDELAMEAPVFGSFEEMIEAQPR
jgi:hypothetical protein